MSFRSICAKNAYICERNVARNGGNMETLLKKTSGRNVDLDWIVTSVPVRPWTATEESKS
jgi:hypothetical protein